MATKKRRLNITLSPEIEVLISVVAKRDKVPEATKISQLLIASLALEEDKVLSLLADQRLKEKNKKLSHDVVWE